MPTSVFDISSLPEVNARLMDESPQEILRLGYEQFQPRLAMATAFGAEGCCLLHMLSEIEGSVFLFNLDTGYQFPETLALRERIRERYGLNVELIRPDLTVAEYEADHGGPVYPHRPDQCCHDRKILPLRRALVGQEAWISAIRRDQTAQRGAAQVVQWDAKFGLVKINPSTQLDEEGRLVICGQTRSALQSPSRSRLSKHWLLALHASRAVGCGRSRRPLGRSKKKECGLHVLEHQDGSGI